MARTRILPSINSLSRTPSVEWGEHTIKANTKVQDKRSDKYFKNKQKEKTLAVLRSPYSFGVVHGAFASPFWVVVLSFPRSFWVVLLGLLLLLVVLPSSSSSSSSKWIFRSPLLLGGALGAVFISTLWVCAALVLLVLGGGASPTVAP